MKFLPNEESEAFIKKTRGMMRFISVAFLAGLVGSFLPDRLFDPWFGWVSRNIFNALFVIGSFGVGAFAIWHNYLVNDRKLVVLLSWIPAAIVIFLPAVVIIFTAIFGA